MPVVISMVNNHIQNMISFFNLSCSYFKKRNPIITALSAFLNGVYTLITSNKRAKTLRYQVQLMYYRMHQMETLMNEYNPNNTLGGKSLNKYR